jgi:hypothetical protein
MHDFARLFQEWVVDVFLQVENMNNRQPYVPSNNEMWQAGEKMGFGEFTSGEQEKITTKIGFE